MRRRSGECGAADGYVDCEALCNSADRALLLVDLLKLGFRRRARSQLSLALEIVDHLERSLYCMMGCSSCSARSCRAASRRASARTDPQTSPGLLLLARRAACPRSRALLSPSHRETQKEEIVRRCRTSTRVQREEESRGREGGVCSTAPREGESEGCNDRRDDEEGGRERRRARGSAPTFSAAPRSGCAARCR